MISHELQFIFVHIPKTGGSSVTYHLRKYSSDPITVSNSRVGKKQGIGVDRCRPFKKHAGAERLRRLYGNKIFRSYFKFSIVRNPYDRMLSFYCYKYQLKKGDHGKLNICADHFAAFVAEQRPQRSYLARHKVHLVRFENLVADLNKLEVFEGVITFDDLPVFNASANSNWDWRKTYTPEMRDVVYQRHRGDFKTFGYDK